MAVAFIFGILVGFQLILRTKNRWKGKKQPNDSNASSQEMLEEDCFSKP